MSTHRGGELSRKLSDVISKELAKKEKGDLVGAYLDCMFGPRPTPVVSQERVVLQPPGPATAMPAPVAG